MEEPIFMGFMSFAPEVQEALESGARDAPKSGGPMTCENVMCLRTDRHRHDKPTPQEELLRMALQEAILEMESMLPYVPEFFREKWNYSGAINAAKAALDAAK